ncbi:MAG: c-type cytochrome biogenesis protein CcsB [Burkholderiales bacterium]
MELTQPLATDTGSIETQRRFSGLDIAFALLLAAGAAFAFTRYGAYMDGYEKTILVCTVPVLAWLGWFFAPLRTFLVVVAALSFAAIGLYGGSLEAAEKTFLLKYFLSSQSAILWMSFLFFLATGSYWLGLLAGSDFGLVMGTRFTWMAVTLGLTGMLVRWYESYLLGSDIGHIPVSNLYEVFVLFCMLTSVMYLYYERRYATRAMGAFVMLVISAAVGFLLWYTFDRGAHEIQPLVPALQSWWMKIHVPANFIGYGAFSVAAMVGFAYLLKSYHDSLGKRSLAAVWGAGIALAVALALEAIVFRRSGASPYWAAYFAFTCATFALIVMLRARIAPRLPALTVLDDVMHRAIAVGFAFFTVATILGALWAAEAWGSYWSWDPKETWALIVWLNYAAWLHMRLVNGMRGTLLAWWTLAGLLVTTFAFLGVNIFLSGLHSYGEL